MDTVRRRRSRTKESEEEDGRVKGTYWRVGGRDEQERWQEWRLPWSWIPLLSTWTWNRKKERKTTTSCRDQRPTQATAAIHITMHGQHTLSLFRTHTHTHTAAVKHTLTQRCAYPCLHILVTIHTIATNPTHSALHSLSLRVMTLSLNQTHTTTRTVIKQTHAQSLSVAYLCTTSLVESN